MLFRASAAEIKRSRASSELFLEAAVVIEVF